MEDGKPASVTLSSRYQVTIPQHIRERLNLRPGQRLAISVHGHRIELVPERSVAQLRGILSGSDTTFQRDEDRV